MLEPESLDELHRLFVAVRPPPAVVTDLAELPRPAQQGVRWTAPETWHITLRFLGDAVPADVIAAVGATMPPPSAAVALGPEITGLGSAVVVPAFGLDDLAADLLGATSAIVREDDGRPFVGHLTLARLRTRTTACELLGYAFDASFPVETVELVASDTTPDGPLYETVHTWAASDAR